MYSNRYQGNKGLIIVTRSGDNAYLKRGSRLSSFVLRRMFTEGDSSLSHPMTSVLGVACHSTGFWQQKRVERHAAPMTEVIGWDMRESPSVNILLMTKLLSLDPLSWDMDCLLALWPLLIPCSLGNRCCTFGFLIFIIVERNFLYNSLYILTERSLKHVCSIRAWVPVSFFLSLFLSLCFSFLSSTTDLH